MYCYYFTKLNTINYKGLLPSFYIHACRGDCHTVLEVLQTVNYLGVVGSIGYSGLMSSQSVG